MSHPVAPSKISLPLLENATLTSIKQSSSTAPISAKTLWEEKPVLFVLIRRPGCLFCRHEALELRKRKKEIEGQFGVRMVAIVNQKLGAQDFADNFWGAETYFDHDLSLFKALGGGLVQRGSILQMFTLGFWRHYLKVRKTGTPNVIGGEVSILGGLIVIGAKEKGVTYAYAEKNFGQIAPIEDVMQACRGVSTTSA